jgi:AcrR family transcriptional regulator
MEPVPTRERLLEAAARVFLKHGYTGASMDQVRQAAGVSNGSLYHHFPTKAQLADALYVDTLHDFHASLLATISAASREVTAEAGVKGLVRAHIQWVVRHPGRAALLHKLRRDGEVTDASEGVSAANAHAFGALKEWVRHKTDAGEMRALPFPIWMAVVFAPAMSLTARWVKDGAPVAPRTRAALEHAAWMAVAP